MFKKSLIFLTILVMLGCPEVNPPEEETPKAESIELTVPATLVEVGKTVQLSAKVQPEDAEQAVIWSVDKEDFASINETGLLTAKAAGDVVVTVKAKSDEEISKTAAISIKAVVVDVKTITIDEKVTIKKGESSTLTATINPNNATDPTVSWTISPEAIATVDQTGKVTAVSAGSATLTVSSVSNPTVTDTCQVVVTDESKAAPNTITRNAKEYTLVKAFDFNDPTESPVLPNDSTVTATIDGGVLTVSYPGGVRPEKFPKVSFNIGNSDSKYVEIKAKISDVGDKFWPHIGIDSSYNSIIRNAYNKAPGKGWNFRVFQGTNDITEKHEINANTDYLYGYIFATELNHKFIFNENTVIDVVSTEYSAPKSKTNYSLYIGQDTKTGGESSSGTITIEYVGFYKEKN